MMATAFDLGGLFLLVILGVSGLKKGLIDGILKIVGIYAAIYVSMHYHAQAVLIILPLINIPENYQTIAGYGIAFLGTMYAFSLLGFILKKLVKTMNLGIVDRIGGITLGLFKAGLLLAAVVWAFAMVPEDRRGTWQKESKLYPNVEFFADQVVKIFGLDDEMKMLESTIGSIASGDMSKISQMAVSDSSGSGMDLMGLMNGEGGGVLSPELLKMLGGKEGEDQGTVLERAMKSMNPAQKGMIQQMLMSSGVSGEEAENFDLMEELDKVQTAGIDRQSDMEKKLKAIEDEAQGRK